MPSSTNALAQCGICDATEAVRLEIVVVNGQDVGKTFAASDMHERRIGEVHRPVGVLVHEGFQCRQILRRENRQPNQVRGEDFPCRDEQPWFTPENKVKQLCHDGRCRDQRLWRREKRDLAIVMPMVAGSQHGQ